MLEKIKEAVLRRAGFAQELSGRLYAEPEVSGKEFKSSSLFAGALKDNGFTVEAPFCGLPTAFKAELENGTGPAVALLAEYDALPGLGHACGHNLHGALSILAALALSDLRGSFQGRLCVIGTPDEEAGGAKIAMAKQGVFDGCSLAMMAHSFSGGASQANMNVLSLRSYTLLFKGMPAHAVAAPWRGHSALAAARSFLAMIDARRECFTSDVKFNAIFKQGGEAANIIPDTAALCVEFRADSIEKLEKIDEIAKKCAKGAALAMDCKETWASNYEDFAEMVRIPALENEITQIFNEIGLKTAPVSPPVGSSDMGNVSCRCPSIQPLLSISKKNIALHTGQFRDATQTSEAFEALCSGAAALSLLALKIFNDENYRKRVLLEFNEELDKKQRVKTLDL